MTVGRSFGLIIDSARMVLRMLPEMTRPSAATVRIVVTPLALGLLYVFISSSGGAAPVAPGNAIAAGAGVGATIVAVSASTLIAFDRFEGTLVHVNLATCSTAEMWIGRMVALVAIGIATSTVTTIGTVLMVGLVLNPAQLLGAVAVLVCSTTGAIGVGGLLGALSLRMRDSLLLANLAEYALPVLCGVVAPMSAYPDAFRWIAFAFPLTHAIEAGRSLAVPNHGVGMLLSLLASVILAVIWFGTALVVWATIKRQARRTGTSDFLAV